MGAMSLLVVGHGCTGVQQNVDFQFNDDDSSTQYSEGNCCSHCCYMGAVGWSYAPSVGAYPNKCSCKRGANPKARTGVNSGYCQRHGSMAVSVAANATSSKQVLV